MKDFPHWMRLKTKLDGLSHHPPLVSESDIWWASVGENVGSEIGGKHDLFSRPVVILKKLAHGFYFVVPTTTKERSGTWYVPFSLKGKDMFACLHQARALDHRRLSSKIGTLGTSEFASIKQGFHALYK